MSNRVDAMNDIRAMVEKRCFLSRRPYRDKNGKVRCRYTCAKSCKIKNGIRECNLTVQPEGDLVPLREQH